MTDNPRLALYQSLVSQNVGVSRASRLIEDDETDFPGGMIRRRKGVVWRTVPAFDPEVEPSVWETIQWGRTAMSAATGENDEDE